MEFWNTCHKIFDIEVPSAVNLNNTDIYVEASNSQHTGMQLMSYQFRNKLVQINLVPRHKSTDERTEDEYKQMDGQTG